MEEQPQAAAVDGAPKASQSSCLSGDTETRFTCFPKLPVEIRAVIWDLMIPPHMLNMREISIGSGPVSVGPRYPSPVILQVCCESRELARRTGSFVVFGSPRKQHVAALYTWFDSHRDTVRIHRLTTMEYLPHATENILYDWRAHGSNEKLNMNLTMLPKLKRFQFQVQTRYIPCKIWDTLASKQRHPGMADYILVDIDDEYEVRLIANMLLCLPEWHDLSEVWLKELSDMHQEKFRGDGDQEKDWKTAREQLQERWIKSHRENVTSAADDPNDEIHHDETHHARMPDFRRVLSLIPTAKKQCPAEVEQDAERRNMLFQATPSIMEQSREGRSHSGRFFLECLHALRNQLEHIRIPSDSIDRELEELRSAL
ncbi:hypothetical protein F5Y03DRAFT_342038 [Xylaria venustula]|nr:hypothetical protein F5Y03DRAFT_342038 [Xylaria venustula]